MRAFAQERAARRAETPRTAPPARGHLVPRLGPGAARPGHDFGRVSVLPPGRGPGTAAVGHRFPFSAAVRRAGPAPQHDSMSAREPEPAAVFDDPAAPAPVARPQDPGPEDGGAVLFPADGLRAAALPDQADKIASTFGYTSSIKQDGPPPAAGEFGVTRPFYAFEKPGPTAVQADGTFTVTGTIEARITYQITSTSGRTDIASDADPDITQQNYRTVVGDLTPSPTTTTTPAGGVALYKGQPPRTRFWAEDLTIEHEEFHADEDVTFGREGVARAREWLNRQTAATYDEVGALLNRVTPIIARHVDAKMALPGRELRAYDDGAPDYRARAEAIKRKGDAKGYAPPPPAPKAPTSPPAPSPKAPTPPPEAG